MLRQEAAAIHRWRYVLHAIRGVGPLQCSGLAPKTVAGMVGRENGPGPGGCSHRQPACHH